MTSQSASTPLQFNLAQCQHLAYKLTEAVHGAESSVWSLVIPIIPHSFKIEVLKLLLRTAKEVESFIQGCREEKWIQAAMVLGNMSEYVSQLSFNLELCKEIWEFGSRMPFYSHDEA